ncbi:MAG: CoA transferase, partial [Phascolarctobacterium sp.]|nr:CoA transferase [Phascolarctobacterium sp.]
NLCTALQRADLIDLIDYEENHPYLKEQLALEFEKRTMTEWEAYLKGKDTCVTPVLNFAEACDAEQTSANEMVLTVNDEELGEYKQIGFAMKMSKTPAQLSKRAPRLGEDTEEILGQLKK